MRRSWGTLLFLALGFVLFVVVAFVFTPAGGRGGLELEPHRTTHSSARGGLKAFYLTLETLGYPVSRWQESFESLKRTEDLMILAQMRRKDSISEQELEALLAWIEDGGRLILLGHHFPLENGDDLLETLHMVRMEDPVAFQFSETPEPVLVPPVQPTLYARDVPGGLQSTVRDRILSYHPDAVTHFGDVYGAFCVTIPRGQGRIVAVADAGIASNAWVSEFGNFPFLINLISAESEGGTIWFDEAHQGFLATESLLAYLRNSPAGIVLLQLLAVAALWLFGTTFRFGPLLPFLLPQRRSTTEQVESMAALYRRTGSPSLALRGIYQGFKRRAALTCGLSTEAGNELLATSFGLKYGMDAEELKRILNLCEHQASWDQLSVKEMITLCRSLSRFEQKV